MQDLSHEWVDPDLREHPDARLVRTEREARAIRSRCRLSGREEVVLTRCYSDGASEADVAEVLGIDRKTIHRLLASACRKIMEHGLPQPKPYGRGSRLHLRAILPGLW